MIDSSVVIKWFVAENNTAEALQVRAKYDADELELLAPDFINIEVGNILWKKHKLGLLLATEAEIIFNDFLTIELELTAATDLLKDAYSIATTHGPSVYDSLYIALSLREQCSFVTADEKLLNAVGAVYPNMVSLTNWS
ncbi:MAG: type II toxin-antitoxin system VapC family toxin [Chloroflexota bacterium]|nr:type II toxin-antitoxin system VapC family toxin [Chloroflexota bacterium]